MAIDDPTHEIRLIRSMVLKARRETADSGWFFILTGIISIAALVLIGMLEASGRNSLALPVLIAATAACGVAGYVAVHRAHTNAGARSYPRSVLYGVWLACGIPCVIAMIVLPLLGSCPWRSSPVLASLFVGIGLFTSGIIFESRPILLCSIAWWAGALGLALIDGAPRLALMAAMILVGWIVPGLLLNRRYRNGSGRDA